MAFFHSKSELLPFWPKGQWGVGCGLTLYENVNFYFPTSSNTYFQTKKIIPILEEWSLSLNEKKILNYQGHLRSTKAY